MRMEKMIIELNNISKSFPGVKSLDAVSFSVKAGEIHALVGENGAGKSTLTKVIAGVYQPDEGSIKFEGELVRWRDPADAKAHGIHVIYQELVLFPQSSVADNIFVGFERRNAWGFIDYARTFADAAELLHKLGVDIDPRELVKNLTIADQQMVEIAKAMVHRVKLLILDEPTAVISGKEVELLFTRLGALKEDGVAIVYISHRLEEIFHLCDCVTVLKDGQKVASLPVPGLNRASLVSMMIGREMSHIFPDKASNDSPGKVLLRCESISVSGRVKNVSMEIRAGEILGIAGMVGSGRTELAMAMFGGLPFDKGELIIDGVAYQKMTPKQAIELGLGLVTEDRKGQGLMTFLDVAANITATTLPVISKWGVINSTAEKKETELEIQKYNIACRKPETMINTLSGGNQQKILISRWVRVCRRVLILDEPTRGVDVGARAEIYKIIRELANSGLAVMMISSELPEVVGMSDRVLVMKEGTITGELTGEDITEKSIMHLATVHEAEGELREIL
jgi:ribose transport system ATP-binding protein